MDEHIDHEQEHAERGAILHQAVEQAAQELGPSPFDCPLCSRPFKNAQALRMHKIRAHSKRKWDSTANLKGGKGGPWSKNQPREQRLKTRRAYQRRLREKYYAEGKDSKGQLRPPGWNPGKRGLRGRLHVKDVPPSRTPQYQRRYQARYVARKKELLNGTVPPPSQKPDLGPAAEAVIQAARVLQAVYVGFKITQ